MTDTYQVVVVTPVANQIASPQGATEVLVAAPAGTMDAARVKQTESAVRTPVEGSTSEHQDLNSAVSEAGLEDRGDEVENILPQLMGSDLDLFSEIEKY